jgi:hypothetical protein
MRTIFMESIGIKIKIVAAFTFVGLFLFLPAFSQDVISWPGGRYALTSDGNMHDPDDIGAIPMSIATMCYAGVKDKIVHFDYANHLGLSNPAKLDEITESCTGVAKRFGLNNSIVFNCQTQLEAATKNFVKEAKRSSSESPLWFICAGPMGTAYIYLEAVKRADAAKLQYIHCVSHSNANNKHNDTPELEGKTWEAMKRDFPEVTYHDIANQNTRDGFCSPIENWAWMNDEIAPEDWKWLYSRNRTASVHVGMFDMSDGGMTYWLISGATNGGNQKGNWDDIRAIFNKAKIKR